MKEKILKFLKDKFNISLIIIQVIAIICYALSGLSMVFVMLFIGLEGVFFVIMGTKFLRGISASNSMQEIYEQLPYTEEERKKLRKKQESANKNNRFVAIILIFLGIVLFFSAFSLIF